MAYVSVIPGLRVASIEAEAPLWRALGFELAFAFSAEGPVEASRLGEARFARFDAAGGLPVSVFLDVDRGQPGAVVHLMLERPAETDEVATRLAAIGLEPAAPPTDRPWGMRDLHVRDGAGNLLVVGAALGA